jgi:hypothetical protein
VFALLYLSVLALPLVVFVLLLLCYCSVVFVSTDDQATAGCCLLPVTMHVQLPGNCLASLVCAGSCFPSWYLAHLSGTWCTQLLPQAWTCSAQHLLGLLRLQVYLHLHSAALHCHEACSLCA